MKELDRIDRQILELLQRDGRMTNQALSERIALSPRANNPVLLATSQGLYKNEAGSTRWERVTEGLQEGTVASVVFDGTTAGRAWCVQFGALYESVDNGRRWRAVQGSIISNASIRKLWSDKVIGNRLLAVTPDLGIFYLELAD